MGGNYLCCHSLKLLLSLSSLCYCFCYLIHWTKLSGNFSMYAILKTLITNYARTLIYIIIHIIHIIEMILYSSIDFSNCNLFSCILGKNKIHKSSWERAYYKFVISSHILNRSLCGVSTDHDNQGLRCDLIFWPNWSLVGDLYTKMHSNVHCL